MFRILFLCFCITGFLYTKSMDFTFERNFTTQLQASAKHTKKSEVIGGYAKYRIALYVEGQKEILFLSQKQEGLRKEIESVVQEFHADQLQSINDRRILESRLTKKLNEVLFAETKQQQFIKATHIVNMVILPDMSFQP